MARSRPRRRADGFDPAAQETAWRAIQVLRSMMPQLNHFARSATGNPKVQVEVTTDVPHTKGNKIFIRPPLGLASKEEHQRSRCGERDSSDRQICKACQIREVLDFYLFHEIAHIAGNTQEPASWRSFNLASDHIEKWHHAQCDHWMIMQQELTYVRSRTCDSMTLLNVLNPYLPMIFNVLEDCRVNRMTFMARPGMERIFTNNMERLLTEGSEVGIDKYLSWSEAPLDSQFMIGLQMVAAGYECQDTLHPDVQVALADEQLIEICNRALLANDGAHTIFELSLEVFERAQVLGYCRIEPCTKPEEPEPAGTGQTDEPEQGSPGSGEEGDDSEPGGEGASEGVPEAGTEPGGDSDGRVPEDDPSAADEGDPSSTGGAGESGGEGAAGSGEAAGDGEPGDSGSGGDDSGSNESDPGTGGSAASESEDTGGAGGEGDSGGSGTADAGTGSGPGESSDGQEGTGGVDDSSTDPVGEGDSPVQGGMADPADDNPGNQSGGGNPSDAGEANATDAAGISGPGEQGASVQGSGELENAVGDAGNQEASKVGPDGEVVPSESRDGRDGESSAGTPGGDSDVAEPGDGDPSERAEAEDGEADYPLDLESDNPWDIDNQDDIFGSSGSQMHGPMPSPSINAPSDPSHGTPDDVARDLSQFLTHGTPDHDGILDAMSEVDLSELLGFEDDGTYDHRILRVLELAINQVGQFDAPSLEVAGNEIAKFPHWGIKWDASLAARHHGCEIEDLPELFAPPETLIGRIVLQSRRVFDDNLRSKHDRNRKSGRINTRVLGRRAPVDDPRLFQKKVVPAKRDYFVVLGGDASYSTARNMRNEKIKRTIHGLSDLLTRLGVSWAGYMHSAFPSPLEPFRASGTGTQYYNYILPFKGEYEAWNNTSKEKLASTLPVSDNLDGHTFEFYRKIAMAHKATDRIVVYFTDGQMPAANKDEELEILQREIKLYKQNNVHMVCVGIQTDSPAAHGLPNVRVDSDEDIIKVIEFIGKLLAG